MSDADWAQRHAAALQSAMQRRDVAEWALKCKGSFLDSAWNQRLGLFGRFVVAGVPPSLACDAAHLCFPRLGYGGSAEPRGSKKGAGQPLTPRSAEQHIRLAERFLTAFEDSPDPAKRSQHALPLNYLSQAFVLTNADLGRFGMTGWPGRVIHVYDDPNGD